MPTETERALWKRYGKAYSPARAGRVTAALRLWRRSLPTRGAMALMRGHIAFIKRAVPSGLTNLGDVQSDLPSDARRRLFVRIAPGRVLRIIIPANYPIAVPDVTDWLAVHEWSGETLDPSARQSQSTYLGTKSRIITDSPLECILKWPRHQPSLQVFLDSGILIEREQFQEALRSSSPPEESRQALALSAEMPPRALEERRAKMQSHKLVAGDSPIEQEPSVESVLAALTDTSLPADMRRQAVIDAEALSFTAEQQERASGGLRRFIEEYRNSDSREDLVAVGCAIRKLVAMLPAHQLSSVALLLDSGHQASIPLDLELEVTKVVVRKLVANPPATAGAYPELASRLMDLANSYLNDRLLPREKYAATALNAVLAILLLRSPQLEEVLERISDLRLAWFPQMVSRRAKRLRDDLMERFAAVEVAGHVEVLNQAMAFLQPQLVEKGPPHAGEAP